MMVVLLLPPEIEDLRSLLNPEQWLMKIKCIWFVFLSPHSACLIEEWDPELVSEPEQDTLGGQVWANYPVQVFANPSNSPLHHGHQEACDQQAQVQGWDWSDLLKLKLLHLLCLDLCPAHQTWARPVGTSRFVDTPTSVEDFEVLPLFLFQLCPFLWGSWNNFGHILINPMPVSPPIENIHR